VIYTGNALPHLSLPTREKNIQSPDICREPLGIIIGATPPTACLTIFKMLMRGASGVPGWKFYEDKRVEVEKVLDC
jgi:hypothetical protein